MISIIFCTLNVLTCDVCSELPKVSLNPQKLVQKSGQETSFSCVLRKGSLPVQFEWLHNGHSLKPSQNVQIDSSTKSSTLILESLTILNAGNYTCRASNSHGFDHSTSYLIVEGPPQWLTKPTNLRVGPKERFNIKCIGIGHPVPSVSWRRQIGSEWQDLFQSATIFTRISSTEISGQQLIKERDEGKYGCEVSNGINPSLWSEFSIEVLGK